MPQLRVGDLVDLVPGGVGDLLGLEFTDVGGGTEEEPEGVGVGEQFAGEGVDRDGLLDHALGGRADRLGLGQHRLETAHRGDGSHEGGALGKQVGDQERCDRLVRYELGCDLGEVGVQPGTFEYFHGSDLSW
ncbi:hypothetical protein [Streptomyces antarcticus]|uniref:hypothetical protein n=1 Tax=Streptomyces antarcticus TaxID=2996458 RepID=UPI0022AECC82|nr:hypothetical protein [Streptomyces sp. H34-S5]